MYIWSQRKEYCPEFLKPKVVRTSFNRPIWEWVVDNPYPKSRPNGS